MKVKLKAIQFNHQENLASNDAFTIRQNETLTIPLPEWAPDQNHNFPAAYARDAIGKNKITVKAQFTWSDTKVSSIWVRASDGHGTNGTNVLGTVPSTEVSKNGTDFVDLTLQDVRLNSSGVSISDVIWKWQFSPTGAENSWADITTTTHQIYTVLNLPTLPWEPLASPQSNNVQIPWTAALDVACKWAAGAQDVDPAAGMVTEQVNALGCAKVTYAKASFFVREITDNFLLTEFLALVNGPPSAGTTMNCSDCATAVSTFSNILGASLSQSAMGYVFHFNHVRKIGEKLEDGGGFNAHEVAWTGDCTKDDALFDACLLLDGDTDPNHEPFDPLLAKNMPFEKYLLQFKFKNTEVCDPDPSYKRHRKFGTRDLTPRRTTAVHLNALVNFYNFKSWEDIRLSSDNLFIWNSAASRAQLKGWLLKNTQNLGPVGDMPLINESVWASIGEAQRTVQVNTYECASRSAAHKLLLTVLGERDTLLMKREADREQQSFGDVAFTDLTGTSILFARGNLVITVRSVDYIPTVPPDLTRLFDVALVSRPDTHEEIEEQKRFRFAEGKFSIGNEVPLLTRPDAPSFIPYKFFSALGEVFLKNGRLFYKPEAAGPQTVEAYTIGPEGQPRKQELKIVILE